MTEVRPRELGVIISSWFFCTVCRKERMPGVMPCNDHNKSYVGNHKLDQGDHFDDFNIKNIYIIEYGETGGILEVDLQSCTS